MLIGQCGMIAIVVGLLIMVGHMISHIFISEGIECAFFSFCVVTFFFGIIMATLSKRSNIIGIYTIILSLVIPDIYLLIKLLITENYDTFIIVFGVSLLMYGIVCVNTYNILD